MILFVGLAAAQVLAAVHVYLSNAALYDKLLAVERTGYLAVPNHHSMSRLLEFSPAFFGGLFFTVSAGAGISLCSLFAVWMRQYIVRREKIFIVPFLMLWAWCLVMINLRGFEPLATSYFVVVPLVVFSVALKWIPRGCGELNWLAVAAHLLPIIVLALTWTSQLDRYLFTDLRDHLLLTNRLGMHVNDFYYRYTLYPAEVFKSLDQKMLKTCTLKSVTEEDALLLERAMAKQDYVTPEDTGTVDVSFTRANDTILFQRQGKTIFQDTMKAFLSRPQISLRDFSFKTDRHAFFRQFTFLSLVVAFPITLYICLFCLLRFALSRLSFAGSAPFIASALCFLAGMGLLLFFHVSRAEITDVKNVPEALASGRWQERVAALKLIEEERLEMGKYLAYKHSMASPYIPERYWLARAMGVSRQKETYKDLVVLLDDPHPNVVCMACYALGRRGDRTAIGEIMKRFKASTHWYIQWHAYKALRTLGWTQTRSQKKP